MKRKVSDIGFYGDGIFNYIEDCKDCKKFIEVDINGFCEKCYKKGYYSGVLK